MASDPQIWCLFQVANNYDQPQNDLVCWWSEKPSIEDFARILCGRPLTDLDDATIAQLVLIWTGRGERLPHDDTDFRLEQVAEGMKQ